MSSGLLAAGGLPGRVALAGSGAGGTRPSGGTGPFRARSRNVGDSRCPGRYVGINGQVVGPVSLYGMVETYRCADNTGNVISLPSRTVAFGLPVPLGDPRSSILGDSTAHNLPEMPPSSPETASEPVAEGEHVLNLLRWRVVFAYSGSSTRSTRTE